MRLHCTKLLKHSQISDVIPLILKHPGNGNTHTLLASPNLCNGINKYNYVSTLTQNRVLEFIGTLKEDERQMLIEAVKKFESENVRFEVQEGATTAFRWRSEFGRPSRITRVNISEADEKDEAVKKPTQSDMIRLGFYNAVPFVGFGFLDNTIMILGGDSIELMVGSVITISTMMAAALGNTLSDIVSIGSAFYVEQFAAKLGVKKPQLTPAQLSLNSTRFAANMGRTLGVTVGCIIGMFPLLFK